MTTTNSGLDAEVDQDLEDQPDAEVVDPEIVEAEDTTAAVPTPHLRRLSWSKVITFALLPSVLVSLVAGAGYLWFRVGALRDTDQARTQSVQAATEATVAMLSYSPDNAEVSLRAAQDRLTGSIRDSYRSLIDDVVIPGAKEKRIAATATVPAAASMTATEYHATVMVFVNQTIIVGEDAPTDTASAVEVTLDKSDGRWLISGFEPK
ncbi:hypothetical protein [Mycolicibacterium nivoides]|uniref:hypothetical protein n=1 Tax=Mycolicibacterium nivoides TaxID=2487344 RepID=UPI003C2C3259